LSIVGGFFGEMYVPSLMLADNATTTAAQLRTNDGLFRLERQDSDDCPVANRLGFPAVGLLFGKSLAVRSQHLTYLAGALRAAANGSFQSKPGGSVAAAFDPRLPLRK
jgi:hypothetical protein